MSAKILITGLPNVGKTTLLKPLKNALVISRDGKPFPFELPHFNVPDYNTVDDLLSMVSDKLQLYEKKFGKQPDTIAFDSVSRIFTDIESNCDRKYNGFDVWKNINKEVNNFVNTIDEIHKNGFNVVLIAHTSWDEKSGKFTETCKGSFYKIGGFMSTVDFAINIDISGNKYWLTHRGNSLSRTIFEDMPTKQLADDFNLQSYIDKIKDFSNVVTQKWSL